MMATAASDAHVNAEWRAAGQHLTTEWPLGRCRSPDDVSGGAPSPRLERVVSDLPIVYEIDQSTQLVYVAVGPWTPEAVGTWVDRLLEDPAYVPGMRVLLNLSFAAGPLPDAQTTGTIVEALRPLTQIDIETHWAVLVPSPKALSRVRLMETLTSDGTVHFRAFEEWHDAMHWLGLQAGGSS